MLKQRLLRLLALLFAFTLVAAACGGSSDGDDDGEAEDTSAEGEQEGGGVDEDAADEAVAGADEEEDSGDEEPMEEPGSIEELEAAWEANRAEIVATIQDEGWGLGEDGVLTGPAGFTIDTNECPSDWSNTEGIADGTLTIGMTTALSGNLAAYGNINTGIETYFNYVNENGGIDGTNLAVDIKDDAYVATQTIELVDELLQSVKPFAIQTLGSPNSLAVYDQLNDSCVPHPFTITGHPAWGDPVNHPWTTGHQMSYATEAILWGAWIKNNMADQLPVTVAGLVMDNDFGLAYEEGMQTYADENPDVVSEFTAVRHDPAAPTVTNEMTTIAGDSPDVFISMTAGNPCLLAVEEAARSGIKDSGAILFAPSVCKDPNAYMIPAADAGDGFLIVGGGEKAFTDPQYADDPYVSFANETMAAAGLDTSVGLYGTGFGRGWVWVETLKIAAELDGGLTRTNFMLAQRAFSGTNPALVSGIEFALNGNEDAFFVEGSDFSRYDAAAESWVQEGNVVDLNGSSPPCEWAASGEAGC